MKRNAGPHSIRKTKKVIKRKVDRVDWTRRFKGLMKSRKRNPPKTKTIKVRNFSGRITLGPGSRIKGRGTKVKR